MEQPILFESPPNRNLDRLNGQGREVVRQVGDVMRKSPSLGFKIEVTAGGGEKDTAQVHEREVRLAQARAEEVKNELVKSLGVTNRMECEGMGYGGGFHGRVLIYPL